MHAQPMREQCAQAQLYSPAVSGDASFTAAHLSRLQHNPRVRGVRPVTLRARRPDDELSAPLPADADADARRAQVMGVLA
jgi:hypothetical protein